MLAKSTWHSLMPLHCIAEEKEQMLQTTIKQLDPAYLIPALKMLP